MGKQRIIAETGAGQHGVATATVCALFNLPCTVYMGEVDIARQQPNVFRMKLLGAEVVPVKSGTRTLKDAMNEALRDWVANVESTFYIIGTVAGPHPYPTLVRDFQSIIGEEVRWQMAEAEGRLPDSLGRLHRRRLQRHGPVPPLPRRFQRPDLRRRSRRRRGRDRAPCRLAHRAGGPACCTATAPICLQNEDGQITDAHSISAGLDYPGIGPEHAWLHDMKRVNMSPPPTRRRWRRSSCCPSSKASFPRSSPRTRLAYVTKIAPKLPKDHLLVMNLCGRGDKDIFAVAEHLGVKL